MKNTLDMMREIRYWIVQVLYVPTIIVTTLVLAKKYDKKEHEYEQQ